MHSPRIDIDSITDPERLFFRPLVFRIRDREAAATDQVGRKALVRMRLVMCIPVGRKE